MARSVWKGPFVEESLIKKVDKQKNDPSKKPIKTWSRKSTIIPDFVGVSFLIYNGKKFIPIKSGIIVDFLDQVLIGFLLGSFFCLSTFFIKLSSTNGPFQTDLAIIILFFSFFLQ